MNPVKIHVTQDRLKELINYDPDTGVFTHKTQRGKTSSIGEVAGCDKPDGYRYMSVEKHRYVAHRVAWLYYYGYDAPIFIDHINGIKSDNRISNLRLATSKNNNTNVGLKKNNKSGYKGVSYIEKRKKYRAQIFNGGKNYYLGEYHTAIEAHKAYCNKASELFGEFANYGITPEEMEMNDEN
jgi:hypothetical protein